MTKVPTASRQRKPSGMVRSWPAAPHDNAFIDTTCAQLTRLGWQVCHGNPSRWGSFIQNSDLYVIHWPDVIFSTKLSKSHIWFLISRVLTNLSILKWRGTTVVWFVHNLEPHTLTATQRQAWDVFTAGLSRLVDGWLTLSPSTANRVVERYPHLKTKKNTFIWHPPYKDTDNMSRQEARKRVGLPNDAIVFGHAGFLRNYKNLVAFTKTFESTKLGGALLYLTGSPESEIDYDLRILAEKSSVLNFRPKKLTAAEFDQSLKSIDVFVAPYAEFLHSGALIHALSRGCVVVAPRAPFTSDLASAVGTDWVVLYDTALPDACTLEDAARKAQDNKGTSPHLAVMEPSQNIEKLKDFLLDIGLNLPIPHP